MKPLRTQHFSIQPTSIQSVHGREILDSRGRPTVEAVVRLADGSVGSAMVPAGASTGSHEAVELRDQDAHRYGGYGVQQAVSHVDKVLGPAVIGLYAHQQGTVDAAILAADGTSNKRRVGANATLAVSLAAARAASHAYQMPLWRYLGGTGPVTMPVPLFNILNGGVHADNNVDVQEFMIVPVAAPSFHEALRMGVEVGYALRQLLREKGLGTNVGDEGGFAPSLPVDSQRTGVEVALEWIIQAIEQAGYRPGEDMAIALDVAATEWFTQGTYCLPGQGSRYTAAELIAMYARWTTSYPILSLEDALAEDDWSNWQELTRQLGDHVQLVGDDLFVTHKERLQRGITEKVGNALLVKLNQVGTLTETWEAVRMAHQAHYTTVISHRSGETEDSFLADFAIGCQAYQIKAGAPCRSERVAKYNQLLRIEGEACTPTYGGRRAFHVRSREAK